MEQFSTSSSERQIAPRRGDYGFDAPYVPAIFALMGLVLLVFSLLSFLLWQSLVWGIIDLLVSIYMLLSAASYIYTTRRGKFEVWSEMLSHLDLRGDEQVLDMGCGRGMVLLMVASLLPQGKASGVDIWSSGDQSGNALEATRKNAQLEGVAEKIELHTADMRQLPFDDGSFDLVLSSLAIHNIPNNAGRKQALDEAMRVLKPGGKLIIADLSETARYVEHLRGLAVSNVTHQALGWRFWYGSPWFATKLVTALKAS
ncbi:MAG TPA: class I SAM-dependent methyltransferase [Ktedonobacteraceae bacterium]